MYLIIFWAGLTGTLFNICLLFFLFVCTNQNSICMSSLLELRGLLCVLFFNQTLYLIGISPKESHFAVYRYKKAFVFFVFYDIECGNFLYSVPPSQHLQAYQNLCFYLPINFCFFLLGILYLRFIAKCDRFCFLFKLCQKRTTLPCPVHFC